MGVLGNEMGNIMPFHMIFAVKSDTCRAFVYSKQNFILTKEMIMYCTILGLGYFIAFVTPNIVISLLCK